MGLTDFANLLLGGRQPQVIYQQPQSTTPPWVLPAAIGLGFIILLVAIS